MGNTTPPDQGARDEAPPPTSTGAEPPAPTQAGDDSPGGARAAAGLGPEVEVTVESLSGLRDDQGAMTVVTGEPAEAQGRAAPAIPGYEILGELGRGGMGVVYKAVQRRLRRPCALKMILAGEHAGAESSLRFQAEAETVARLRHPNIVQIYCLGDHEGRPFVELEYLEKGSLAQRLDGTPWPPRAAARLVECLARAMQEAHRQGVVHRDLKPANVLLTADDVPKITDFGLAKSLKEETNLTQSGAILGSPSYMAPEQAEGKIRAVGPAADIYALGAILYELLTGRPPFKGATVLQTLRQVKDAEVVPPARLVPGLSRDLETVALVCLQKEPGRRYATAEALAEDLRRFLAGEPILARRVGPLRRAWRWCGRNPSLAGLLAAVASLLVLLTASSVAVAVWMRRAADDADRARRDAGALLTDMHTSHGLMADERGDAAQAMLWFAHAARLARDDPERARANRARVKAWGRQAVLPVHALPLDGPPDVLAFAPDARHLLASSRQGPRALWDLGREEPLPWAGGGPTGPALLSPDGGRLALASDGGVEVRAVPSGELLRRVDHRGAVRALAFSPDGHLLAIGGDAVRVWDCRARAFATAELPHPQPVVALAFSPKGDRLSTGCLDGLARVFAVPTGAGGAKPLSHPVPHVPHFWFDQGVAAVAPIFLEGGRNLLVRSGSDSLTWHHAGTGAVVRSWRREGVTALAASADGRSIAVGGYLWAVVINTTTGAVGPELAHRNDVGRVIFSPDGRTLLTLCEDLTARLWSVPDGKPLVAPLALGERCRVAAFSPDGRLLALALADGLVRVGRLPRGAPDARRMPHDSSYAAALLSRERPLLIDSRGHYGWELDERRTRVYDVTDGRPVGPFLEPGGLIRDAALAPDGRTAVTASKPDTPGPGAPPGSLHFWDPRTGGLLGPPVTLPSDPRRVAFSPDDRRVAVFGAGKEVLVVEPGRGRVAAQLVHESEGTDPRVCFVIFTPGGDGLVTAGFRSVQVWDLATGRRRYPPLAHGRLIFGVCLSHNARWLATGSMDGRLRVWDLGTGRPVSPPMRHADWVYQPVFSPDDRHLVAGCRDGTVRVWDWRAGRLIGPPMRHESEILGLALTRDGRSLLTVTSGARLRAWDWRAGKALGPTVALVEGGFGRCMNVEITPDGRDVVVGTPRASVAFGLADLVEPDESSPDDLVTFAELTANQALEQGEPVGLTTEQWLDRWRALRRRHPGHAAVVCSPTWEEQNRAARLALRGGGAAEALRALGALTATGFNESEVRLLRAEANSRLGRWDAAAGDLARLIALDPSDHFPWYQSAVLYLQRGDAAGYRRHCRRMLDRFGATADPVAAERVSKACLLGPLPESDRDEARRLAEKAVEMARARKHSVLPWALLSQALADYRGGRFGDAIKRADDCLAQRPGSWSRDLPARLIRAMADNRRGRVGEARSALAVSAELFGTQVPGLDSPELGSAWHDRLICDLLRREAEALIADADDPADSLAP